MILVILAIAKKLSDLKDKLDSAIKEVKSTVKSDETYEEIKKLFEIAKDQQKLLSKMEAKENTAKKNKKTQAQCARQAEIIVNKFFKMQDAHFPDHVAAYLEDRVVIKTTRKTHVALQKLLITELKLVSHQIK